MKPKRSNGRHNGAGCNGAGCNGHAAKGYPTVPGQRIYLGDRLPDYAKPPKRKSWIKPLIELTRRLNQGKPFATSYDAGFDCGRRGPNASNCDHRFFLTRADADEWQRGNIAGVSKARGKRR